MSLNLSERHLFYALLLFWFAGLLMIAVQHPYRCKFFTTLPAGSGTTTPDKSELMRRASDSAEASEGRAMSERGAELTETALLLCLLPLLRCSPHENLQADWWFHFTHRLTLTAYVLLCCFLQLLLFSLWYLQMAAHTYLEDRREREAERGRRMREYGFWRCLRSILRDSDDEIEVLPETASRCECVCGCCCCFSTACSLWFLNCAVILTLIYLLAIGYGSLEAASRFDQNTECRRGLPAGIYIFVLNAALLVLYCILALMRCLCSERGVVQKALAGAKELRARVQTRKGRRNGPAGASGSKGKSGGGGRNPTYAQLDHAALDAELGLELSDDEDENGSNGGGQHNGHGHGHSGQHHDDLDYDLQMELDDAQNLSGGGAHHATGSAGEQELADDLFEDDPVEVEDEVFAAHKIVIAPPPRSAATAAAALQQPKPHRPSAGASSASSTTAARLDMHDDDTREMLEMLGPSGSGSGSGSGATVGLVSPSEQRRHQARAEAALDELETQADMP